MWPTAWVESLLIRRGLARLSVTSPGAIGQFTQALVAAIEQYGKRKVGRRRNTAVPLGALPRP